MLSGSRRIWCHGLPLCGTRTIEAVELAEVLARRERDLRFFRRERLARRLIGVLVGAVGIVFVAWNPGEQPADLTLVASIGLMGIAAALSSLVACVVVGRSVRERLAFSSIVFWLLLFGLTFVPEWVQVVGAVGMGILPTVALVVVAARAAEAYRLEAPLRTLAEDLRGGDVLIFRAADQQLDVFPLSRLIQAVNGDAMTTWQVAELKDLADPLASEHERPLSGDFDDEPWLKTAEGLRLCRRPLEETELGELRAVLGLMPRHFARSVFATFCVSAMAALFVERVVHRRSVGLSTVAWCVVAVVVLVRGGQRIVLWRRIRRDLRRGEVLRARAIDPSLVGWTSSEVLPASGIIWSMDGSPAHWRTIGPGRALP